MKKLAVILLILGVGMWVYFRYSAAPQKPPTSQPTNAAAGLSSSASQQLSPQPSASAPLPELLPKQKPPKVPFAIRLRVKQLIDDWKRLELQKMDKVSNEGLRKSMGKQVIEIRRMLFAEGYHDENSLKNIMLQAALELGHPPDQCAYLINRIWESAHTH